MQNLSPEEEEYKFNKMLERLETQPKYMDASLEKFRANPTNNGAKILWLKYTTQGKQVPPEVMSRMVEVIEHEALGFKSKLYSEGLPEPVFELIYLAKCNSELFWEILHSPSRNHLLIAGMFGRDLLDEARDFFPTKKKIMVTELYGFTALHLKLDLENEKAKPLEAIKKRFERFVKKHKK